MSAFHPNLPVRFRPIADIGAKLTMPVVAALYIARTALLLSILAYVVVLAAGVSGYLDPGLTMLFSWYATIAIAATAAACVVAQLVSYFNRRR